MNPKKLVKPLKKNQKEVERYLKEINFDERLKKGEYFTNEELRELLIKNLEKYFAGKRTQKFIIELGAIFYEEVMFSANKKDDPLMTSVCVLNDFALNYKVPSSPKKREEILQKLLLLLKNELSLKEFLEILKREKGSDFV